MTGPAERAPGRRRNVLFITGDQWRGDCLSVAGHPCVETPNLDRLAADATRFARHFGNATPCGPSRASMMTGRYLHGHRSLRNGTPLDRRHPTLAQEVRRSGLDPALFGYTDTARDPRGLDPADPELRSYQGVLPGFTPVCIVPDSLGPYAEFLRGAGYDLPDDARAIWRAPAGAVSQPAHFRAEHSDTAYLTDRVLSWLGDRRGAPWFAHVSYLRPHPPWIAPAPYNGAADRTLVPPPRRAATAAAEARVHPWLDWRLATLPLDGWLEGAALDPRDLDPETQVEVRAVYYGLITELDHHIGRLLDHLDATGQTGDTLILVTADHGEMLGDHHLFGKEGWYDQAFHVPLIVRDPDPAAAGGRGRVVEAFTEHVDLMPTILDWLGVAVPRACDGRSLRPFLAGAATPADWRTAAHWQFDFRDIVDRGPETALGLASDACCLMVRRTESAKYVHFPTLPPLFYDLEADPGEFRDLAGDPTWTATVLAHAQAMLSWRMLTDDRTLSHLMLTPDGVVVGA